MGMLIELFAEIRQKCQQFQVFSVTGCARRTLVFRQFRFDTSKLTNQNSAFHFECGFIWRSSAAVGPWYFEMRMHSDVESKFVLATDERLGELARILARAILRLHSRAALATDSVEDRNDEKPRNSSENCLELPAIPRLSVIHGLTDPETPEIPKPEAE